MANKAAGKGYENDNHYTDIKFQFCGIENIHVMRASLQKLMDGEAFLGPEFVASLSQLCFFLSCSNVDFLCRCCMEKNL